MPNKFETRSVAEFRADDTSASIEGYAANFLTVDSFGSTFGRSAFRKTIRERGDRIPILFNHNENEMIGKATELRSDSKGLKFKASIVETSRGADVMKLIRAEVLTGMSFGFRAVKDRAGSPDDKIDMTGVRSGTKPEEIRFIEEVNLKELSPVPFPSNPRSQIDGYRSEDAEEIFEELLESIRSADLTSEQIEKITLEVRSLADTLFSEQPPSTVDEESRRILDMDIDLLLAEIEDY